MVPTHQDVNASPCVLQVVDQGFEKKPMPAITGELEPVVENLAGKTWSNPATWPGGQPATPVCSFGLSTPPLDADELAKELVSAAEARNQSGCMDIDNGLSQGITEACEPRFKKVLEIWDKDTSKYKVVESIEPEVDDFSGFVFVVREHVDSKSKKSTTYIDIKSDILRDILREVLENVKTVSVMEAKPSIQQVVLFHFLPELKSKLEELANSEYATGILPAVTNNGVVSPGLSVPSPANPDAYADCTAAAKLQQDTGSHSEGVEHLRLLVDHIDEAYAAAVERLAPLLQRGEITYDLLELLFKPGCHLYTKCLGTGKSRCVAFEAAEETTRKDVTHLKLECHYLDHDDHEFGEVGIELGIVKFRGRKPIHTLEVFPLQYHPDREDITQNLVERGRKLSQFVGRSSTSVLIQHCKGKAFIMKDGKPLALNIDSRVAIDAALFREMMPNYRRPRVSDCWEDTSIIRSISLSEEERQAELEKFKANGKDQHSITEAEYLICCPTVWCFSFNEKIFLECAVGDLSDVQWSPVSPDHLQIPEDTKQILLSVTTSRLSSNKDVVFDDFIKGKGRGLNILLFGPPGVGKTLTAEAMAEGSRVPLYSVGDSIPQMYRLDAHGLEMTLDRIFKIAKHLDTILLIDEADVFMENRASFHGNHNRLVTVFLRKLEYYEGVLFLTTNRVTEFDEAILSRIHLKMKYPELTLDSRRSIWKSFLAEARTSQGPAILERGELEQLASMKLNGREASHITLMIKNLTAIAQALASVENVQVTFKHLAKATRANDKFVEEFNNSGRLNGLYT